MNTDLHLTEPHGAPAAATLAEPSTPTSSGLRRILGRYFLQIVVLVLLVLMAVTVPNFASTANLQNLATQGSFAGLIACGMTLLIAGGMFDLSVAGIVAVSAVVTGAVLPHTTIGLAIVVGLATGCVLGAVNGLVVAKIGIPAFIATFGMYNIYTAVAFMVTGGSVLPISSYYFQQLGTARVLGLPLIFLVFVGVCVLAWAILYRTYFGRQLRAIGSSETAARMAGIPIDRVKILAFVLTGLFTAVAAVGLAALLSSANGSMATSIELSAITIAVVGGTALRGGQGTLLGTFTGAIFIAALSSALNLVGLSSYWQSIAVGLILVIALVVGAMARGPRARGQ